MLDDFITTKWWTIIENCCSNENYYSYQFTLLTLDWFGSNESERFYAKCVCVGCYLHRIRVPSQFDAFPRPTVSIEALVPKAKKKLGTCSGEYRARQTHKHLQKVCV